jgi:L-fuculose-phosphate aldolase
MQKSERDYRQDVVEVGRWIWQKGWIAANDGNITVRLSEDRILATPTGVCKGLMKPDDLIVCDMQGSKIAGEKERTSEIAMHLTIYEMRPDVTAIVHAHPPVATGYAVAGRALDTALLPEVVIGLGCVPLAEYGLPGTPELTGGMLPYIPSYDAILMQNHGVVSFGEDLTKAFFRMETVEHFARISLVAELLGGARALPRQEVQKLLDARSRYGVPDRKGVDPDSPVCAEEAADKAQPVNRSEIAAVIEEVLRARGLV